MFEKLTPTKQIMRLAGRARTASEVLAADMAQQFQALADREHELLDEIAARQQELADVRHTARAVQAAMVELQIHDTALADGIMRSITVA